MKVVLIVFLVSVSVVAARTLLNDGKIDLFRMVRMQQH
jgi:hypothetical protein